MMAAVLQAERNARTEDNPFVDEKPIAIIHKTRTPYLDSLVMYRLATMIDWELGEPEEK